MEFAPIGHAARPSTDIALAPQLQLLIRIVSRLPDGVIAASRSLTLLQPRELCGAASPGEQPLKRVSVGGSLARATFGLIRRAAAEIRDDGTFGYAEEQVPDAELCQFFAARQNPTAS